MLDRIFRLENHIFLQKDAIESKLLEDVKIVSNCFGLFYYLGYHNFADNKCATTQVCFSNYLYENG